MATLLFVVALLHMGLGYALAVYLGHAGPNEGHGELVLAPRPTSPTVAPAAKPGPTPEPETPIAPPHAVESSPIAPAVEPPATPDVAQPIEKAGPVAPVESTPVAAEPTFQSAAEPEAETESLRPSHLAPFQAELDRYRGQLAEIDTRLRDCVGGENAPAAHDVLRDLKQTNQQYMQQQADAIGRLSEQVGETAGLTLVRIDLAVTTQAAEIADVNQQLDNVDLDQELTLGLQMMLDQALRLFKANNQFQAALDDTQLEAARAELSPEERTPPAPIENLTERADFEAAVTALWQSTPSETRPLTVAVIDVDNFRDFSAINGVAAADRTLHSIAQIVGAVIRPGDLATRFGGQRFVVLFPRTSARDATPLVERARQTINAAWFQRGEDKLALTVSCALTEAVADDNQEQLLARAESTLQEAKRYGRNRTFLHEGNYAAPVVPPRFTIESRVVEI